MLHPVNMSHLLCSIVHVMVTIMSIRVHIKLRVQGGGKVSIWIHLTIDWKMRTMFTVNLNVHCVHLIYTCLLANNLVIQNNKSDR